MNIDGVSFKKPSSQEDENLSFRIDVLAYVSADKRYCHDYENKTTSMWLSLEASCMLNDGMKNFKITGVEEYIKEEFDGRNNLSRSLLPYLYVKDADDVAEQFLMEYCPAALEEPMRLPAVEVASNMGLEIYSAPLENNICGKIYFDPATVKIYKKYPLPDLTETNISAGKRACSQNTHACVNDKEVYKRQVCGTPPNNARKRKRCRDISTNYCKHRCLFQCIEVFGKAACG